MKIALCIPAYGMVHAKWMQCVTDMIVYTLTHANLQRDGKVAEIEFSTFIVSSSNLCESRHRLAAEATMWEADYLLWLDADHVFPKDAFCRLWAQDKDIVGANYSRRCFPTAPTAAKLITADRKKDHNNLVYTTKEKADAGECEEVSHLGFGFVLMKADIFNRLQAHAESQGKQTMMPLFMFGLREDGMSPIGEDVFFFQKCREAGVTIWCDHAVSETVGHVHEFILFNAHAVQQEAEWLEMTKELPARLNEKAEAAEAA